MRTLKVVGILERVARTFGACLDGLLPCFGPGEATLAKSLLLHFTAQLINAASLMLRYNQRQVG